MALNSLLCADVTLSTYTLTHPLFLGSQPTGDISHKTGGRLLLLFTRPTATFRA